MMGLCGIGGADMQRDITGIGVAVVALLLCGGAGAAPAANQTPNEAQCTALRAALESHERFRDAMIAATSGASETVEGYLNRHARAAGEPWYDELQGVVGRATALVRQPFDRHSTEPLADAQSALRAICSRAPAP
jgi:hypothetical protein